MGYPWTANDQALKLNELITADGAVQHPDKSDTDPRLCLQRDRDRIVWSTSFRRLAQKTQIFPQAYGDHHRRRLTHSLEVMQLSSSIARTLGLNPILCEAIALAHDLGHTPFGHAGEDALDFALKKLQWDDKSKFKSLSRFTHYEQGVDVASYIDSPNPDESADGLRLHYKILEGILKHTSTHIGSTTEYKSLDFLLTNSKYNFEKGSGSLEAQAVRICDKISYFISDIEDGLIMGVIHLENLLEHDVLKEQIDGVIEKKFSAELRDHRIFLKARNGIISALIESVLEQSEKNLNNRNKRLQYTPIIDLPPNDQEERLTIFNDLQKDTIFRHFLVDRANKRAKHIVSCLFCQYLRHPELMPWTFRRRYRKGVKKYFARIQELYGLDLTLRLEFDMHDWWGHRQYEDDVDCVEASHPNTKQRIADLVCIKDYIAGMTDQYAEERFKKDVVCQASVNAWQRLERITTQ
jgi:dGTPase